MTQLVVVRNPFDRTERDVRTVPAGSQSTVAALVGEYIPAGVDVSVSINGHVLAREAWPTYSLAPRDEMVVMPVVGKGNSLLGAVLMIAVMVAAPYAAAAMLGEAMTAAGVAAASASYGMGFMAVQLGFGLVGGMAVGSLIDAGIDVKADLAISQNLHQLEGALE